jgi:hypothetical protein
MVITHAMRNSFRIKQLLNDLGLFKELLNHPMFKQRFEQLLNQFVYTLR